MNRIFVLITACLLFHGVTKAQNTSPFWSVAGNSNATGASKLGTTNSVDLRIVTNNIERIRVNTAGNVGIGTTAPAQKLHVLGNGTFSGNLGLGITAPTQRLHVVGNGTFSGNLGIGTAAPTQKLQVVGNGLFTGNVGIGAVSSTAKLNVVGSTTAGNGINVSGYSNGLSANATYAYGNGVSASTDQGYAVFGTSNYLGVYGYAPSGSYGTYGYSKYIGAYGSGTTYGVYGYSSAGSGVYGYSSTGDGVVGTSVDNYGGNFTSTNSWGLVSRTTNGYYAGVFYGAVWSSVGYFTSDKNLKKDVRDFSDAMSIINKLKPQDYTFKDDPKFASLNLPKGRHYGLLAQDLEQVLPNLVSEAPHQLIIKSQPAAVIAPTAYGKPQAIAAETNETKETINIKAINYVELIPIMVKAMQEQEVEINTLKSEINELKALIVKNANGSTISAVAGYLKQNNPNPLNGNTVIKYFAPNDARNAQILVTDMKGSVLKTYKVPTGEGQLIIANGELASGTYNYTLYVNNNKIDTKQMIIVR